MKSPLKRSSRVSRFASAAIAALLMTTAADNLHAGIINSGDLLTVSSDGTLRSYTFGGALQQTLAITGFPPALPNRSAQGVAVINGHLYIGLIKTTGSQLPKIVEVNPATGAVISIMDTAATYLTALGDDGTNLLLLDSVPTTPWQVYTYNTTGGLVTQTSVDRHFPLNFQGEGIDGDGKSIFMSGQVATYPGQPVITNTAAGTYISDFSTGMLPLVSFIGGLAYNPNDETLWIAGNSEFRQFSRTGTLLSVADTGPDNTGVTGLEVIAPTSVAAVPEPASFAMWSVGALGCVVGACTRRKATAAVIAFALSITFVSPVVGQTPESLSADDDRAIRNVVATIEKAWNTHDMKLYASQFREDAEWVNKVGMHWRGRDEIMVAHIAFHQTIFKNHSYLTDSVKTRTIAPGVAVAVATLTFDGFTAPDGREWPKAQNRLTYVLLRGTDGWKIAHGQNAEIDSVAAPSNPVNAKK